MHIFDYWFSLHYCLHLFRFSIFSVITIFYSIIDFLCIIVAFISIFDFLSHWDFLFDLFRLILLILIFLYCSEIIKLIWLTLLFRLRILKSKTYCFKKCFYCFKLCLTVFFLLIFVRTLKHLSKLSNIFRSKSSFSN